MENLGYGAIGLGFLFGLGFWGAEVMVHWLRYLISGVNRRIGKDED